MAATRQERIAYLARRQNLKNLDTAMRRCIDEYGFAAVAQILADHAREASDGINATDDDCPQADKAGAIADLCEGLVCDLESADEI